MRKMLSGDIQARSTMWWSIRRHIGFLVRHMTMRRLCNGALCALEMQLNRGHLLSHPVYLRVCTSDLCNLRCTGCLLSQRHVSSPRGHPHLMSLELFKRAVHDFLSYVLKVNLYDEGEPLLNPAVCKMAEYLAHHKVAACISSNFSMRLSNQRLEELLGCGLEHLIVAVDGATQETYSRYRRGGDLDLVIGNLRRLMTLKRDHARSKLKVEFQFIEFDHNRHELPLMQQLAKELGVWRFAVIQGSSPLGWRGTDFTGTAVERRRLGCYQAWVGGHINSDGSLGTCDYGEDHGLETLGWAWDYRSQNLRNHPRIVELRSSFRRGGELNTVCTSCSLYRRSCSRLATARRKQSPGVAESEPAR